MNVRAVVCTILGLRRVGDDASLGRCVLELLVQRDVCGAEERRSLQCGKLCSSFLEGKSELEE